MLKRSRPHCKRFVQQEAGDRDPHRDQECRADQGRHHDQGSGHDVRVEEMARIDAEPLPQYGNLVGALQILRKTETELSARTPTEILAINSRFAAIQTRGDARAYAASVMEKVGIAREQRKIGAGARR